MPEYKSEKIRNIAFAGHGGAGKTTLVEALLLKADVIKTMGDVAKGNTVCDYETEEREHGHSLSAAIASLEYAGAHVNLVDTPGYPDFIGRALPAFTAVESVAVVVDARSGIGTNTRRIVEAAGERGLCRMIVVNKIDSEELDLEALMAQITDAFGKECLPINLPAADGAKVVDCFFSPLDEPVALSSVADAHTQIIEQVVEVDEELMEAYLEHGDDLPAERVHAGFEQALREGHLVPVCFASATTGAGIAELLEVIARLMPNPSEANPAPFRRGEVPCEVNPEPDGSVVAHVFKLSIDAFVGRLGRVPDSPWHD